MKQKGRNVAASVQARLLQLSRNSKLSLQDLLSQRFDFQGERLAKAIAATFARRNTEIPATVPVGLSTAFAVEPIKHTQWKAFWRKVVRTEPTPDFAEVVKLAGRFLLPAAEAARVGSGSPGHWIKGGPWRES